MRFSSFSRGMFIFLWFRAYVIGRREKRRDSFKKIFVPGHPRLSTPKRAIILIPCNFYCPLALSFFFFLAARNFHRPKLSDAIITVEGEVSFWFLVNKREETKVKAPLQNELPS